MTTITAEQALKSKQNFSEFLENNTPVQVTSTIADYQAKSGKVVVTLTDLTQNFDTFVDVVNDPTVLELPQKPYFAWIVTKAKKVQEVFIKAFKQPNNIGKREMQQM